MNIRNLFVSAVIVAAIVAYSGQAAGQSTGSTSVSMPTHLGQQVSNLVTLIATGTPLGASFARVDRKGITTDNFTIPSAEDLVVTDVEWQCTGAPSSNLTLNLWVQNLKTTTEVQMVFSSTLRLDPYGNGGISEHMTSGFVIRTGSTITVTLPTPPGVPGTPVLTNLIIHGYLTS